MRSAFVVWLVTSTLLPWASKCPTRFPMVCVFPVPGGPCTKTPPCSSSCWAIRICSGFAGLLNSTSPSVWAKSFADGFVPAAPEIGDSSPTIFSSDQGKSSRVRRSARMPSIAAANPNVRARRKSSGSRPMQGSFTSVSGARSSRNSPRGESSTTRRFRKLDVEPLTSGWKPPSSNSSRHRPIARPSTSFIDWNKVE